MTRSGAYNLRSALLTPSARQEIEVKRERAASPDLQALSARPRKKQKTHASHLNADVSEASGSARHTRAHDANPRPDCLVCYPGGAPKKIKIEATVVRHTRAHDSVPHPDCDVCRLSRPSKPTRPKRHPKKASLRKTGLKKSSRVSASPTPSLAFDILSSEADTGPLTPLLVDDEPDSFEVVKESTSGRSACSFSSSLAHIQEYLSDGSTPFIAEGRNHHAYTHFSLAASDSAPLQVPQQDSHSMQHSIPPSASSAPQNLSRFRAPHDQSKGRSPPPRSDSSAFSKITMRNSAATSEVSCHLSASNSHRSTNSSAILPPRLKHKSLKVQLASSGPGSAALYYKVSGSGTNASTEPSHPMHGLPVTGSTPTSPTGRLPPPTGTQPACSSQLALTGTIGGGLQASVLSGPNQPLQPLVGLSEHPGVPRHDASYFRPLVAHTESTVSMPKKITSRLQLSSNQGFRDVYSIGSKATGPHCMRIYSAECKLIDFVFSIQVFQTSPRHFHHARLSASFLRILTPRVVPHDLGSWKRFSRAPRELVQLAPPIIIPPYKVIRLARFRRHQSMALCRSLQDLRINRTIQLSPLRLTQLLLRFRLWLLLGLLSLSRLLLLLVLILGRR